LSANRYLPAAQTVARTLPGVLVELGLDPLIDRFVMTETEWGDAWLFAVLDERILKFLEAYADNRVLAQLSAAFHGHLVLFSNYSGPRYAILLSPSNRTNR
jgi:hypothetical protein